MAEAIAMIESRGSGNYGAVSTTTDYGRAYGRYQIIPPNINKWTAEAVGKTLKPQQFLDDKQAQDLTALLKITKLLREHKPTEVARIWFANRAEAPQHWTDAYGTTVAEYVDRFERALSTL